MGEVIGLAEETLLPLANLFGETGGLRLVSREEPNRRSWALSEEAGRSGS